VKIPASGAVHCSDDTEPHKLGDPSTIDRLTRLHGEPWLTGDKGLICDINHEWWAALIQNERNIIYEPNDKQFYVWDPLEGLYVPESYDALLQPISRRLLTASQELDRPELTRWKKLKHLESIRTFIRMIGDRPDAFTLHRGFLPLNNGVIELAEGKIQFSPFDPRFMIKWKSEIDYIPGAKCPRYIREFLETMLDDDDIDLFQRYAGLLLLGINLVNRMAIFGGESAAGKTTGTNLLVSIIGEPLCIQLRTEHLDKQFELESFRDRMLLIGNDVGANFLNTPGAQTLKGLCSTDLYHPEAKGRTDRRPLRGPFHVIIGTNCKLTYHSQGDGAAWARRLLIFDCKAPKGRKKIPNFERTLLREEGPGIINWMLEGLTRALEEIERTGDLVLTETQAERIQQLVMRSEAAEMFAQKHLALDPDSSVTSSELLERFYAFCQRHEWTPPSDTVFLQRIAQVIAERFGKTRCHNIERDGKKAVRGWRGLALSGEEEWTPTDPF